MAGTTRGMTDCEGVDVAKPTLFECPDPCRWVTYILQRIQPDPVTGCWHWTKTITATGYGRAKCNGVFMHAHRLAWLALVGPIPETLQVDHQCHNRDAECFGGPTCPHRRCVNPAHLRLASPAENAMGRRVRPYGLRGCRKHGMADGHPKKVKGQRPVWRCLACQRERYAANRPEPKPRRTTCAKGHEYTDENTLIGRRGDRICRQCSRERVKVWKAARRAANS